MKVKWIKIVTDIFDDEKMLLIESMPESDAITVIWFKLLCLAGKTNNSGVFMMNNRVHYTDEMLATIFRKPVNTIRLALKTFESFGMIEIINNVITIPNWSKHQTLDQMEERKNYMKNYMKNYRQKQKLLAEGEEVESKVNSKTNSKVNVNEADIEEDKDIDIDKDIYSRVIDYLNKKANTNYRSTTRKTQQTIKARFKEGFKEEEFYTVIDKKASEWLNDEKMCKFLRPETLFGTKFESYLNQKVGGPNGANRVYSSRQNIKTSGNNGNKSYFSKCELTEEERRAAEAELL